MTQSATPQMKHIKACVFTLILYMRNNSRQEYFDSLVRMIIEKFPCRIILIEADPDAPTDYLEHTLSEKSVTTGDVVISCDQHTIKAGGAMSARVPFVVLPLIVPDLPIYLLWTEDPTIKNEIFAPIHQFTSHLILDCDIVENTSAFSAFILKQFEDATSDLIDMKWVAIAGWRNVLLQAFESPASIEQLQDAQTIQITYNAQQTGYCKHTHSQATYLQAWIAACLHWTLEKREEDDQRIHLRYKNTYGRPVDVELLKSQHDDLQPGLIVRVAIACRNGLSYDLARRANLSLVTVHISSDDSCALPFHVPLPNLQRGISFMKEIFYASHSTHYHEMLELLAKTKEH